MGEAVSIGLVFQGAHRLMGALASAFKEGTVLRLQDLGELGGELLVFGGPYSNLQATRALMAEARTRGIPASNCICTGDVVAYCADAVASIAAIRDFGCRVVAGNCEKQLAEGAADCGCGFEVGTTCDVLSAGWYGHANTQIGGQDRAWMADLPDVIRFTWQGQRVAVLHGGATNVARFLWPVSPEEAGFAEEIRALESLSGPVDIVLAGHCGIAFAREVDGRRWINAGVIGMPPHDGRAETRFAILSGSGAVFHRLGYDHQAARAAMVQAGLTQGYQDSLQTGVWPSEDVLPKEMRRGG